MTSSFNRAIEHLDSYTPDMDSLEQSPGDVPPLTEFFEMVHIGDVIQQMVQLYYDERIVSQQRTFVGSLDLIIQSGFAIVEQACGQV